METIAIYARVSTDKQNVDQQVKILKEYCDKNDYQFRSFVDAGESGRISDRPQWKKLILACENGKFKTILVQRTDRITRKLKYALKFWDFITQHQIKLISLYEGNFDYLDSDHYFNFMLRCLLSEKELVDFAYRRQIGIERAKKEGKYKGGKKGRSWKNKI